MASFTFRPPVGHGHRDPKPSPAEVRERLRDTVAGPREPAPKTGRSPKRRAVAGVILTKTALGHTAQGVAFERVEDEPPYWRCSVAGYEGRTLGALVRSLKAGGHLVAEGDR